jgi:hypothetical protein
VHNEDTLVNARARLVSNIGHKCFEEFARKNFRINVLKNLQEKFSKQMFWRICKENFPRKTTIEKFQIK